MKLLKNARICLFFFSLLIAASANAVVVTHDGVDYDITTVEGTYASLSSTLESQPWFLIPSLASPLTLLVSNSLGTPNASLGAPTTDFGPLFAYGSSMLDGIPSFEAIAEFDGTGAVAQFNEPINEQAWTFAVGSAAVPIPAAVWLFGSGLIGLAGLRRKK